jgi:hypothetical protein
LTGATYHGYLVCAAAAAVAGAYVWRMDRPHDHTCNLYRTCKFQCACRKVALVVTSTLALRATIVAAATATDFWSDILANSFQFPQELGASASCTSSLLSAAWISAPMTVLVAIPALLPKKLLTARVPVEEKRVGGRELTWGEGVEEVLKRASHAFPSLSRTVADCWWELGEGGTVAGFAWRRRWCYGRSEANRPRPYFVPAAVGCCCRDLGGLTGLVGVPSVQTETAVAAAPTPTAASAAGGTTATTTATADAAGSTATAPSTPCLPPPSQQHTQSLRRSSHVRRRTTPAPTQYTTRSSFGSGVDDGG